MAEKRMFSKKIIDSARFLKMPISTQLLYFHLGLQADDDGVVEAYNVIRKIGACEDDLKVLVAKNFVIVLNEDLVTFITDWQQHNLIRPDRKIDSIYKNLLLQFIPDNQLLAAKKRADTGKKTGEKITGQQMDDQLTAQDRIGQDRLDSDSDQDSILVANATPTQKSFRFIKPTVEEVTAYCKERGNSVNSNTFVNFYESKGWKVGREPMKDWKAAVRTWEQKDNRQNSTPTKTQRELDNAKYLIDYESLG